MKIARDALTRIETGLGSHFHRAAIIERREDPLLKYGLGSTTSYVKRVGGRLLQVIANDVPIIAAAPGLASAGKELWRGFCPCGQHVLSYGVCQSFWDRCAVTNASYIASLLQIGASTSDYSGVLHGILDAARELNFKAERGSKVMRTSLRKSIIKLIPPLRLAIGAVGVVSDASYVLTGQSLHVSARLQGLEQSGMTWLGWDEFDEIVHGLWWCVRNADVNEDDKLTIFRLLPEAAGGGFSTAQLWAFLSFTEANEFMHLGRRKFSVWCESLDGQKVMLRDFAADL